MEDLVGLLLGEGPVVYEGPLDKKLFLHSMVGSETLGQLSSYTFDFLCETAEINPYDLLGQPAAVKLEETRLTHRYFRGIVTAFGLVGSMGSYLHYRATVRPPLWFLTRRVDCRIFQRKSVRDILELVFGAYGLDVDMTAISAGSALAPREFVVQYRESDFNFVSRLMEAEGIYYFFVHDEAAVKLVIGDSLSMHKPVPGFEELPYLPPDPNRKHAREHIDHWKFSLGVKSGAYGTIDYNFEMPEADMVSQLSAPINHPLSEFEVFDYPGLYTEGEQGTQYAKLRLEQLQASHATVEGQTDARGLTVGHTFTLTDFPRGDQNAEYLVSSAQYRIRAHKLESLDRSPDKDIFRATFNVHRTKALADEAPVPFRFRPRTPKPIVRGPQTAVVAGKDGEEIYTDEYGRVKVYFRWDRYWESGEEASCFIRVAQISAGDGYGALFIPRMGDEVIVDFLEGDPDRPIITGSLYHAMQKPPYDLPGTEPSLSGENKTQSGIKTRSSQSGAPSNFNAVWFEDKKGSENFYVQAEKDQNVLVKNNQTRTVKKNRAASVGGNDSISVGGDRSVSVDGNLSVTVKGGGKSANHSETMVTGKHHLHASDTIEVDAPTHILFECKGSSILIEPEKITITAGGKATVVLDASVLAKSAGESQVKLDGEALMSTKAGGSVKLTANAEVKSNDGSKVALDANAAMTTAGNAKVGGANVAVEGSTKVSAAGGAGKVELGAAGAKVSGPQVEVSGGVVKIN
ncbi:MAG TPA: type VI secretion system tip protein TssI/VgrG [Polyangiaceae bacterium]|nr:type VI secretion system tip protein TssI/VgrG [Polyangiaceae bacterium]